MRFDELKPVEEVILTALEHDSMTIHDLAKTTGLNTLTLARRIPRMKRKKLIGVQRGIIYYGCGDLIDAFLDGRTTRKKTVRDMILTKLRLGPRRRKDIIEEMGKKYAQLIDDIGSRLVIDGLIEKKSGIWHLK